MYFCPNYLRMQFLTPTEINAKRNEYFIVDIREKYEYDFCNINCLNIPMAEVCDRIDEIPVDQTVVIMCKSGRRASALANLLVVDYNRKNIAVMEGGIEAWRDAVDSTLILD